MSALPEFTTPETLAGHLGWSPRRVRNVARSLGACRIMGNRMILFSHDVVLILKAAKPDLTIEDVKNWISDDAAETIKEMQAQSWAPPAGSVYFVQRKGTDEVKIGFTIDMQRRLINFRSATTEDFSVILTIPGTLALEQYFHTKFKARRIAREWFRLSGEIEEFIARRQHNMAPSGTR